jgi:hypothetical protein
MIITRRQLRKLINLLASISLVAASIFIAAPAVA